MRLLSSRRCFQCSAVITAVGVLVLLSPLMHGKFPLPPEDVRDRIKIALGIFILALLPAMVGFLKARRMEDD